MSKSKIEWTDATWNPVTGCTKVSAGCKNCYAERLFPKVYPGRKFTDVQCHPERLEQPLRWRKPRRVFVNSMSDLFHKAVPDEFIDQVFAVMALCSQHEFQCLSKRPKRMMEYINGQGRDFSIAREIGRIRDRRTGTDLATKEAARLSASAWSGERLSEAGRNAPVQTSKGGISHKRRISPYNNDDQREENCNGSASCDLGPSQWTTNTGRTDDQPRERPQVGELAGKSGIGDLLGTEDTCDRGSSQKEMEAQGIVTSQNPPNRSRCVGDQATQGNGDHGQGACGEIRNEQKGHVCNLLQEDLETHLVWPLPNAWLGVSIEDQATADERIPLLLQTPAAVRFVSYEPALAPIALRDEWMHLGCRPTMDLPPGSGKCDWLICGGESGPKARPMHPDWARSVRDQCQAAGVPFFFKQWGEYCWPGQMSEDTWREVDAVVNLAGIPGKPYRVGKKKAGRLLDGKKWSEFPK